LESGATHAAALRPELSERRMRRTMCKSKIHRATLTGADLNYVGSLTVDRDLMDAADMRPYEQVHVVNVNNGNRLVTYIIEGERGSGTMQLNGAAARLGAPGDVVIVITYAEYEEKELDAFEPCVVFVDAKNRRVEIPAAHPGSE
jgi:aspartate 1-decarboxylase